MKKNTVTNPRLIAVVLCWVLALSTAGFSATFQKEQLKHSSPDKTLRLNAKQLSNYNGTDKKQRYVAYQGKIYDVTDVAAWKSGSHKGIKAGQDVTALIGKSPHGDRVFDNLKAVGVLIDTPAGEQSSSDQTHSGHATAALLGQISALLLLILLLRFPVFLLKGGSSAVVKIKKLFHQIHAPVAGLLLGTALVHGVMMLEGIGWHTGTMLWILLLLSAAGGMFGKKLFPAYAIKLHRWTALLIFAALLIHLYSPWLFQ